MKRFRKNLVLVAWLVNVLLFTGSPVARAGWFCPDGQACPPTLHPHASGLPSSDSLDPISAVPGCASESHACCSAALFTNSASDAPSDTGISAVSTGCSNCVLRSVPANESQISTPAGVTLDPFVALPEAMDLVPTAPVVTLSAVPWSRPPPGLIAARLFGSRAPPLLASFV